jgi:hypothetical protein
MADGRAWVLNLDADLELGSAVGYSPSLRTRKAMESHADWLEASLLAEGDVRVDETSTPGSARGRSGWAFCPTTRAIAILRRVGAEPEPHPTMNVLRKVNSRAFASSLGVTLPDAAFVTDGEGAYRMLQQEPRLSNRWRVKPAFGMSGRNHRIILPSKLSLSDRAFVDAGLARGGIQIEPNVPIENEYAMHGLLSDQGEVELGRLVRQRCDARGAWLSTEPAGLDHDNLRRVNQALEEEAMRVAQALHSAGYFGPFGIDAFTYREHDGGICLQPRSEINARYSMGYAVGMRLVGSEPGGRGLPGSTPRQRLDD